MLLDKDTIIGDILDKDASCETIFLDFGMHCMSCPAARGETLEEACAIHDVDAGLILQKLCEHMGL